MSAPLRVLHVLATFGTGGTESGVVKLLNHSDPARVEAGVCVFRPESAEESLARLRRPVFFRSLDKGFGNDPRVAWRLARAISDGGFRVVHSHGWPTYVETRLALALRPSVAAVHGEHGTSFLDRWRRRKAFGALSRRFARFLFVSEALRREFAEKTSIDPARMRVIPNGVDTAAFSPEGAARRDGFDNGALHVGSAGRFHPVKNHRVLLDLARRARDEGVDLHVHLAGDGELRGAYERYVDDHDLRGRVHLHGTLADMAPFYRALDLFVLCSHSEGHPNALMEAMACGVPVATTPVGDLPGFLEDGENAYLVAGDDPDALWKAALRRREDPEGAARVGAAGLQAVRARFSLREMVDAYARTYEEVAG